MSFISAFVNDPSFKNRTAGGMDFRIPVNVLDGAKEFIVVAEISGISKDKVEVTIENNILAIKAEKAQK
jgi:HSP20 family molecular chaperone IbpA